jgi:hypothetical protein
MIAAQNDLQNAEKKALQKAEKKARQKAEKKALQKAKILIKKIKASDAKIVKITKKHKQNTKAYLQSTGKTRSIAHQITLLVTEQHLLARILDLERQQLEQRMYDYYVSYKKGPYLPEHADIRELPFPIPDSSVKVQDHGMSCLLLSEAGLYGYRHEYLLAYRTYNDTSSKLQGFRIKKVMFNIDHAHNTKEWYDSKYTLSRLRHTAKRNTWYHIQTALHTAKTFNHEKQQETTHHTGNATYDCKDVSAIIMSHLGFDTTSFIDTQVPRR